MNCKTCRIEIEEVGAGESLSPQARAHVSACPVCRAFHDERQALKKLVGSLEPISAPADFDFRLRARLNAGRAAGGNGFSWRSFLAGAPALGLAAAFALLVAGIVVYNQMKPGPAGSTESVETAREASGKKLEERSGAPASAPAKPAPAASPVQGENPVVLAGVSRPTAPRGGKSNPRRNSSPMTAGGSQRLTNELAVHNAPVITPGGELPLTQGPNPVVQLPVRSASQPVRVFLDDRSGARRSIKLEPVVFGSQDLAGRADAHILTAHGIW